MQKHPVSQAPTPRCTIPLCLLSCISKDKAVLLRALKSQVWFTVLEFLPSPPLSGQSLCNIFFLSPAAPGSACWSNVRVLSIGGGPKIYLRVGGEGQINKLLSLWSVHPACQCHCFGMSFVTPGYTCRFLAIHLSLRLSLASWFYLPTCPYLCPPVCLCATWPGCVPAPFQSVTVWLSDLRAWLELPTAEDAHAPWQLIDPADAPLRVF